MTIDCNEDTKANSNDAHLRNLPMTSKDGIFRYNGDDTNGDDNDDGQYLDQQAGIATFQRRHDFWHTLAGVVGNVLEW